MVSVSGRKRISGSADVVSGLWLRFGMGLGLGLGIG